MLKEKKLLENNAWGWMRATSKDRDELFKNLEIKCAKIN